MPTVDPNAIQTSIAQTQTSLAPTPTPLPTNTPTPSKTPLPSPTPTTPPEPIVLTGTGDSVVDVDKWDGPAIARVKYTGGGNFAVWNVDDASQKIDLLINTIGAYEGVVPVDFLDREHTARFEITASGSWEIQVLPLDLARRETIPSTIQGVNDDVIILQGSSSPDLLTASAPAGTGNFAIWSYSQNGRDLVINEIAPYSGTVALDRTTILLVIVAEGQWTIEITTR